MGNCLVTKLKSVVNNDNLTELGVIVLKMNVPNDDLSQYSNRLQLTFESDSVIKATNGKNIYSYNASTMKAGESLGDTVEFTANTPKSVCFPESGEYKIKIYGKYSLTTVGLIPMFGLFDINDLEYSPIQVLASGADGAINSTNMKGDLDKLPVGIGTIRLIVTNQNDPSIVYGTTAGVARFTNLQELNLSGIQLSGNISNLGVLRSLTTFKLVGSKVEGDLVEFVRTMASGANGIKTKSFSMPYVGTNSSLKFNAQTIPANGSTVLSWQPSSTTGKLTVSLTGMDSVDIDDPS